MKHFFFKFGRGNMYLQRYLENNSKAELQEGDKIDLSIFFDDFTVDDYRNKTINYKSKAKSLNRVASQIQTFFDCGKNHDSAIFWIYYGTKIYVCEPQGDVKDCPSKDILRGNEQESFRKAITSKVLRVYEKRDLPEAFSSINSSQRYNRKTIERLRGIEEKIANHYYKASQPSKMQISNGALLEYLSPVQFETLIFLIFHHNKVYASTYRGGTMPNVDLTIKPHEDYDCFKKGEQYYIQVKMSDHADFKEKNDHVYLVHLGKTDTNKCVLGKDWIEREMSEKSCSDAHTWLLNALECFDIVRTTHSRN